MSIEIKNNNDVEESCCNPNHHHPDNNEACCLCQRLKYICYMQKKCCQEACCLNCEACELGSNIPGQNTFNTRPFYLYLTDGTQFSFINPIDGTEYTVFRVESIRNCCGVLRALTLTFTGSTLDTAVYTATDFCCTVDICKFIGIQCLPDTYISC
ncbi:hypothetical protein KHQ81_10005 [Mycoplasmatota bacterium]|nr:hypothetical protein KHQ81_10005 [Mycoplasmatota bacterium]